MNLPFVQNNPDFLYPNLMSNDTPYDDDEELTKMEEEHQSWLKSFSKKPARSIPVRKPPAEPRVEEAESTIQLPQIQARLMADLESLLNTYESEPLVSPNQDNIMEQPNADDNLITDNDTEEIEASWPDADPDEIMDNN
ncbi:unnamed protein product [Leptosia nina]|uniref:Uncharacterized protein n=1 Tax=Leptosia nina TaxID=320188 RepID=A0AAV1K0T9_9NEOP